MKKPALRLAALLAWAAGAGLFFWVFSQADFDAPLAAVRTLGWGIAGIAAYHALPLWPDVVGWRLLFFPPRPSYLWMWWGRWVGEAAASPPAPRPPPPLPPAAPPRWRRPSTPPSPSSGSARGRWPGRRGGAS